MEEERKYHDLRAVNVNAETNEYIDEIEACLGDGREVMVKKGNPIRSFFRLLRRAEKKFDGRWPD